MADARLDFPFAIGVTRAARQRNDAVMGDHVTVERIERRIVDVRRLEYLRGFLRFCEESDGFSGIQRRRSSHLRVSRKPTLPFEEAELERALSPADKLNSWGTFGPKQGT